MGKLHIVQWLQRFSNWRKAVGSRDLLAVTAGVAWALAFPPFQMAVLAWIAPGLLVGVAWGVPGRTAFRLGYLAGLGWALVAFHWLLYIPFPAGALAGWVALSLYLALFPAVWTWMVVLAGRAATGRNGSQHSPAGRGKASWFQELSGLSWRRRCIWTLWAAALWTGLEVFRGWFLTGFPWNPLGVSQVKILPLIQIASVTGVYGVSFLVVWFSIGLATSAAVIMDRPDRHWNWVGDLGMPLVVVLLLVVYGMEQLNQAAPASRVLRVALIQPSIPQTLIWDPSQNTHRFNKIMELSREALEKTPDLLVWPETSLPGIGESEYRELLELIRSHGAWMVFGADDAERVEGNGEGAEPEYRFYNSAYLVDPAGSVANIYHKQKLVVFGEYVPLSDYLPFLKYLTPIEGGFSSGDRPVSFSLDSPEADFSVLICFEDVFQELARKGVGGRTDFLLNLTNDGWFGRSTAQWQHAYNAVFRAIENRRPLVRCTNNGISCWVDEYGRVHATGFEDPAKSVYDEGFKLAEIPLAAGKEPLPLTFFQRHGNWVGWSCLAVGLFGMGVFWMLGKRNGAVPWRHLRRRL